MAMPELENTGGNLAGINEAGLLGRGYEIPYL
jgi:hypothetical protein